MNDKFIESRENRGNILKITSGSKSVGTLFGDIIDNKYNRYLSKNAMEYKETEKFGIIVTGKGGSTITNHIIKENDLSSYDTDKQNTIHSFFTSCGNFLNPDDYSEIKFIPPLEEFKKILEGKSKKDLIIVTRNPVKKWMSGLIQELTDEMHSSITLASFISEKYNFVLDDIQALFDSDKIEEDVKKTILSDLAFRYVHGSAIKNGTTLINHMYLYNEIFYLFLENNNIDLSKLKILDIDSDSGDIVELFKLYYPELNSNINIDGFWTHRFKWDLVLGELHSFLLENDRTTFELMKNEVQRDLYYYNLLLKKYEKNLIK